MYLKMLLFLPLLAMMNMLIVNSFNLEKLEKTALTWSMMMLMYFSILVLLYDETKNFQFTLNFNWFSQPNNLLDWGKMEFSIDGLSMFFIGLSMILIPISMLMSWSIMNNLKKEFLICLFLMLLFLLGVFSILDILGFYMLFEAILMPMFLIMGMWGSSEEKVKAAFYFFFYTLMGSLLMLMSMFKMYSMVGSTNYFNLILLELPNETQFFLFIGFFASLAVKMPMIPFHIWLPQAHVEAPVAGSILLAGMLLKLGGYGFISFSYSLFPMASEYFTPIIIILSLLALMYGSLTTCSQTDMKSLIAYSSVSHMGLVTLAMFVHSLEGLMASMTMMMAHGLVSSGLFMTSAVIYVSHHSSTMSYYSGLVITMPLFSMLSLMLILANISFPLTFNFMAEFLSILASFNYSFMMGILSCIGALLSTVYALYYFNSMYFGSISKHLKTSSEMLHFEFQSFLPLMILTLILGIMPNIMFKYLLLSSYMNISL